MDSAAETFNVAGHHFQRDGPSSIPPECDDTARFRAVFKENMPTSRKPIKYEHVSALLLSYDGSDPHFAEYNLREEVNGLEEVFRQDYDFHVEQKLITRDQSADLQMRLYLAEFAFKYGKEHGLIIVYYGGHGWHSSDPRRKIPGSFDLYPRQLELDAIPHEHEGVMWEESENTLHHAKGDVLVIFDCCDAGSLAQLRSPSRAFEYIGACEKGKYTHGPGEKSFTSALTWALKELKEETHFTTQALVSKIKEHKKFPGKQNPVLFPRSGFLPEHIWLGSKRISTPITSCGRRSSSAPEFRDENCDYVDFRVIFSRPLSDQHGKDVAMMMAPLIINRKLPLNARHVSVIRKGACKPSGIHKARWTRAWNHIAALNSFQKSVDSTQPVSNQKRKRPLLEAEYKDQSPTKYTKFASALGYEETAQLPATPTSEMHDSGSERTVGLRVDTALRQNPKIVLSPSQVEPSPLERVEALMKDLEMLSPEMRSFLQAQLRATLAQEI